MLLHVRSPSSRSGDSPDAELRGAATLKGSFTESATNVEFISVRKRVLVLSPTSEAHLDSGHEVDGATRAVRCITHWELKHLTTDLPKNELLIFNSKGLDFLQGFSPHFAKTPFLRFLLSGGNVRDVCRYFAVLWGIMLIEPERLALPLLYEAVARGGAACLSAADCDAVRYRVLWSCRSLQSVVRELADWSSSTGSVMRNRCGPSMLRCAKEAMDIQEQIGANVLDYLDEHFPDWIDELADETWREVGGW